MLSINPFKPNSLLQQRLGGVHSCVVAVMGWLFMVSGFTFAADLPPSSSVAVVTPTPSATATALPSSIHVEADELDYVRPPNNPQSPPMLVLKGKVTITQGESKLLAERVEVTEINPQTRQFVALGAGPTPALFQHRPEARDGKINPPVLGQAERITYNTAEQMYRLQGNALLVQEQDRLTAQNIVYNAINGQYRAESTPSQSLPNNARVRLTFTPKK